MCSAVAPSCETFKRQIVRVRLKTLLSQRNSYLCKNDLLNNVGKFEGDIDALFTPSGHRVLFSMDIFLQIHFFCKLQLHYTLAKGELYWYLNNVSC